MAPSPAKGGLPSRSLRGLVSCCNVKPSEESTIQASAGGGATTAAAAPRGAVTEFGRVFVKAFHSLAVLAFAAATFYLMYCAITGRRDALVVWSLVMIGAEAVIYAAFGRRCPLTLWARNLGDDGGHDYLFEWLLGTKRIKYVARTLALLGAIAVVMMIVSEILR